MKRRKKEFGIYMLLGMDKGKISRILIIETLLIGIFSLAIGLAVGILLHKDYLQLQQVFSKWIYLLSNSPFH